MQNLWAKDEILIFYFLFEVWVCVRALNLIWVGSGCTTKRENKRNPSAGMQIQYMSAFLSSFSACFCKQTSVHTEQIKSHLYVSSCWSDCKQQVYRKRGPQTSAVAPQRPNCHQTTASSPASKRHPETNHSLCVHRQSPHKAHTHTHTHTHTDCWIVCQTFILI